MMRWVGLRRPSKRAGEREGLGVQKRRLCILHCDGPVFPLPARLRTWVGSGLTLAQKIPGGLCLTLAASVQSWQALCSLWQSGYIALEPSRDWVSSPQPTAKFTLHCLSTVTHNGSAAHSSCCYHVPWDRIRKTMRETKQKTGRTWALRAAGLGHDAPLRLSYLIR